MKTILTLMMTGCLAIAVVTAQSRSAADQYQEALRLEEIKGDRKGAIEQYKKLAQGSDRAIAAKAQARLTALQSAPVAQVGQSTRLLWSDLGRVGYATGAPSADGRYLSFSQGKEEDGETLGILDMKAGRTITHTDPRDVSDESEVEASAVSPDGRQVAYIRGYTSPAPRCDLRVLQLNGGKPAKSQMVHRMEARCMDVNGWSPDSKSVVMASGQIAVISVAGGSVRVLRDSVRSAGGATFSPDGRYVAYHARAATGSSDTRDIFVVTMEGLEIRIAEGPGDDRSPMWSPDGSHIVFLSNRTGNVSLWMVPVAGGKPNGPASLVKANLETFLPLGMTRSGALYYLAGSATTNVYTAELDAKLTATAPPSMATNLFINSNSGGVWSPDGQYLAYRRGVFIRVRSVKTGEDREVPTLTQASGPVRWFPDGQSLLVPSRDTRLLKGNLGYYRVNIATGNAELLHQTVYRDIVSTRPDLSSDGKTIFYLETPQQPVRFEIDGRRETKLTPVGTRVLSMTVSPDGAQVAYLNISTADVNVTSVVVAPANGGEPREVSRFLGDSAPRERADGLGLAWSPDQRSLFFVRPGRQSRGIWRVPVAGGEAENIGVSMNRIHTLRMHPDGRRIAFDSVVDAPSEVWALENFLPRPTASK